MKKLLNALLTLIMATVLCLQFMPAALAEGTDSAKAREYVEFLMWTRNSFGNLVLSEVYLDDAILLDQNHMPKNSKLEGGEWYVVRGTVQFDSPVEVDGNVGLILTDGCELICNEGLLVEKGFIYDSELEICATSPDSNPAKGKLRATGRSKIAGIGSRTGDYTKNLVGDITIHGGHIVAYGGEYAAGIGGGNQINGGKVTIYGGKVEAYGGFYYGSAGIGGGSGGNGGSVTVYGGSVTAKSYGGASIGAGTGGDGGNVTLYGGTFDLFSLIGSAEEGKNKGTFNLGSGLVMIDNSSDRKSELFNGGFNYKSWNSVISEIPNQFTIAPCGNPVIYEAYNFYTDKIEARECKSYRHVQWDATEWKDDGWYVVHDSGTFTNAVTVSGNVNLIILNGKTLTANGGIRVEPDAHLNVYAQPETENEKPGALVVSAPENIAGIGGGYGQAGGALTIHGCDITVTGGANAAGFGGGYRGKGGDLTLYGGSLTANAGTDAPCAIGEGRACTSKSDIICGSITVRDGYDLYDMDAKKPIVRENGKSWSEMLNGTRAAVSLIRAEAPEQEAVAYRYYDDQGILTDAKCTRYFELQESTRHLSDGWYVLKDDLTFSELPIEGNAHLILTDGHTLKVQKRLAIEDGKSLTIYAQSNRTGMGALNAIKGIRCEDTCSLTIHGGTITAGNERNCAGIGCDPEGECGTITIYGGVVNATGADNSAGIGGCQGSTLGTITINGGKVAATGGEYGAGIGGGMGPLVRGKGGDISSITINGGEVTANGGDRAAGIGCGYLGTNANVVINGGEVTANGGDRAAGIGAYMPKEGVRLTINGGNLTSNGRNGGNGVICDTVSIQGGDVTASGSEASAFFSRIMSFADDCLIYINDSPTPLPDRSGYQLECTGNRRAHIVCGGALPDVPQTGDTAHPALWSVLSVFSLAGFLIIAGRRKRAK